MVSADAKPGSMVIDGGEYDVLSVYLPDGLTHISDTCTVGISPYRTVIGGSSFADCTFSGDRNPVSSDVEEGETQLPVSEKNRSRNRKHN